MAFYRYAYYKIHLDIPGKKLNYLISLPKTYIKGGKIRKKRKKLVSFLWDNDNVIFFPCKFCIVTTNKTLTTSYSPLARPICALKPQTAPLNCTVRHYWHSVQCVISTKVVIIHVYNTKAMHSILYFNLFKYLNIRNSFQNINLYTEGLSISISNTFFYINDLISIAF
jgi:hypothetical protein